jgi:hypothetical protein
MLTPASNCARRGSRDVGHPLQWLISDLGRALSKPPKSRMRMLSAEGNPQAHNLCEMLACLQKIEGTVLEVHAATAA